jgi:hypothetical protein
MGKVRLFIFRIQAFWRKEKATIRKRFWASSRDGLLKL